MRQGPKGPYRVTMARDEFMSRVLVTESGCWEWQGYRNPKGHGRFLRLADAPHRLMAHRYAYALFRVFPGDRWVLHHCDNPPCCNPDHLYLGDASDNARDMVERGQHWQTRKTHCKHGHAFDEANTGGNGQRRRCRACQRRIVAASRAA